MARPRGHREANRPKVVSLYDGVTETQWLLTVDEIASTYGWLTYHTWRSDNSPAGFPDLCMVRDRIVFAELKAEGGRVTADQWAWHDAIEAAGGEWYLWRPHDVAHVHEVLR